MERRFIGNGGHKPAAAQVSTARSALRPGLALQAQEKIVVVLIPSFFSRTQSPALPPLPPLVGKGARGRNA